MTKNDKLKQQKAAVIDTVEREAYEKKWYVAETRMHHEKKVRDQLQKLGIECFLPSQTVVRQWKYRKKKIEQILIPMKVFVRIGQQDKLKVLQLTLVTKLMQKWDRTEHVIIADCEMDRFMFMLKSAEKTVEVEGSALEPGVQIRVINGPLSGLEGCLISQNERSKIRVEMNVLGFVCVEISVDDVEIIM